MEMSSGCYNETMNGNDEEKRGFRPTKSDLYEWLDAQRLCVIATVGEDGYPNAATVGFSQSTDLEFVIITDKDSRKAANIARSSKAALTITNEEQRYTVQLEGNARQLSWDEFEQYADYHYKKLPFSMPFRDIPGQTPFVIVPTKIRFSDISVRPWALTYIEL